MFYALFNWTKSQIRDYREFPTEEEMTTFLAKHWDEIAIYKLIEALAELKFGLSTVKFGIAPDPIELEGGKVPSLDPLHEQRVLLCTTSEKSENEQESDTGQDR